MQETIIRLHVVKARTGLGRSTIYWKIARGEFPRGISLGAKSRGWIESEINKWIEERIRQSRAGSEAG